MSASSKIVLSIMLGFVLLLGAITSTILLLYPKLYVVQSTIGDLARKSSLVNNNVTVYHIENVCMTCIFPFEYEGKFYTDCAVMGKLRICASKVDTTGALISGRYKICPQKGCNWNQTGIITIFSSQMTENATSYESTTEVSISKDESKESTKNIATTQLITHSENLTSPSTQNFPFTFPFSSTLVVSTNQSSSTKPHTVVSMETSANRNSTTSIIASGYPTTQEGINSITTENILETACTTEVGNGSSIMANSYTSNAITSSAFMTMDLSNTSSSSHNFTNASETMTALGASSTATNVEATISEEQNLQSTVSGYSSLAMTSTLTHSQKTAEEASFQASESVPITLKSSLGSTCAIASSSLSASTETAAIDLTEQNTLSLSSINPSASTESVSLSYSSSLVETEISTASSTTSTFQPGYGSTTLTVEDTSSVKSETEENNGNGSTVAINATSSPMTLTTEENNGNLVTSTELMASATSPEQNSSFYSTSASTESNVSSSYPATDVMASSTEQRSYQTLLSQATLKQSTSLSSSAVLPNNGSITPMLGSSSSIAPVTEEIGSMPVSVVTTFIANNSFLSTSDLTSSFSQVNNQTTAAVITNTSSDSTQEQSQTTSESSLSDVHTTTITSNLEFVSTSYDAPEATGNFQSSASSTTNFVVLRTYSTSTTFQSSEANSTVSNSTMPVEETITALSPLSSGGSTTLEPANNASTTDETPSSSESATTTLQASSQQSTPTAFSSSSTNASLYSTTIVSEKATSEAICFSPIISGDGWCDDGNNIVACDYDGGDCCLEVIQNSYCSECICHLDGLKHPGPVCNNPSWIGDKLCDDENNNDGCSFDGGDCCDISANFQYCTICLCLLGLENSTTTLTDFDQTTALSTSSTSTFTASSTFALTSTQSMTICLIPALNGDGWCDDDNNIEACDYDGGDCCLDVIQNAYCSICICLHDGLRHPSPECNNPAWIGDSLCDDENNNSGCSFDGGDCCSPTASYKYCTICECLPN